MTNEKLETICSALYGYGWQRKLAKDVGVNERTVRRWASGDSKVPPPVERLIEIKSEQD